MRLRRLLLLLAVLSSTLAVVAPSRPAAGAEGLPPSPVRVPSGGYQMVAADGGIFAFGRAPFHGSAGDLKLNKPIVGMAQSAAGSGYWLVANDGGIFSYGDARFLGSTGDIKLNRPIVGMAATPTGRGYWLVATDGGIFNYGDARFEGSTGALKLTKPIVGMAPTPTGRGYWLVGSDGGIFAYGDAGFFGSTGDIVLNKPIVGMASTPTGKGYWLVASDGGLFAFGDAPFFGSTGAMTLTKPIVGMTPTRFGHGYWLYASDGGIFAFGDAGFYGSTGDIRLNSPIVGMSSPHLPERVEDVAIFYYAWYGTPTVDGSWDHWNSADPTAGGSAPKYDPEKGDIASNYFPASGPYSSRDPLAVERHMREIASAGVNTVVYSWWGRGGRKDEGDDALELVAAAARRHGLRLAIHAENYPNRTPADLLANVGYFKGFGVTDIYIYVADDVSAASWRQLTDAHPELRIFAKGHDAANDLNGNWAAYAQAAGFDGIYTYESLAFAPEDFARVCALARARSLACVPSIAPGYDARRALNDPRVRDRRRGALYDEMWDGAIDAGADVVSIISYNEWGEGTQIEPAMSPPPKPVYRDEEGVDYLARTARWANIARTAA